MNETQKPIYTVKSREWPWSYTFILTEDAVVKKWTKPFDTAAGECRYPMEELSPQVTRQMEFGHGSHPFLRKAVMYLAGSACVLFSDFNHRIPLLAPFLAVPGIWTLILGALRLREYVWTIIHKKNGDRAFWILHSKANRAEVEAFERQFAEAMSVCLSNKNPVIQGMNPTSEPALGESSSLNQG